MRYTITIRNIGNENAVDVILQDFTPANTVYVINSTTLNGVAIADTTPGLNPLHSGILINAPELSTSGSLPAGSDTVAVVTFDVVVDVDAMDGLVIENQGFVNGHGEGSGAFPEQPSDDPATPVINDPTRNVVGNLPLLYSQKTVEIFTDLGSIGIVDPDDVLRYRITITNSGAIPSTLATLTDNLPNNTTYIEDSLRLNSMPIGSDGGVLPADCGT